MELKFRPLEASEIDVRMATVKENGISLLLYKDARCDMNILDETVGAYNWKREHTRDNANCIVSIWDSEKGQWISKEDTGTESFTEKEKGLASDSFKRACFNWGIGRELYTAPFIWVPKDKCNITENKKCFDKFYVEKIKYDSNRNIIALSIINENAKKLEILWQELENIRQLILLCEDGLYKRTEIDADAAISIMKTLSVLMGRAANIVDQIVNDAERVKVPDRSQ